MSPTHTHTHHEVAVIIMPQCKLPNWASQVVLLVKNPPAKAGDVRDMGSIPGSRRFPGVGNGDQLQYSCLENPMDRKAWRATVYGVTKSRTPLSIHTHSALHKW